MSSSGLDFSRLVLGTVQFGLDYGISNTSGKTQEQEAEKILKAACDFGINTIDTAAAYGNSEKVIGNNNPKRFNIISKFPATVTTAQQLCASVKLSLDNLQSGSLYGLLAHDADVFFKHPALWETMNELKAEGLIKKAGYSLYLPGQLEQLLINNYTPDIVQVPYNFIDVRFEKHFDKLKSIGCEIHVRSVFLQGLFFLNADQLPGFFDSVKPLLRNLKKQFSNNGQIAAFLMYHVLKNRQIDKLVFGVNTSEQLVENIELLASHTDEKSIVWNEHAPEEILMPNLWPK